MPSQRMEIPFTGESHKGKNIFLNSEDCINYYPEILNGKVILRGSAGLLEVADLETNQPVRASIVFNDKVYFVSSDKLYRMGVNYNIETMSGASLDLTDDVYLIENSLQIGIFGGDKGYVYTLSTDTITQITDLDFPGASSATFQNGYGIVSRPGTAQFWWTGLNDFTSWGGLDFSTAGWKTDNLVRVFSDHEDLMLMGVTTIEPWQNTTATSTFVKISGAQMQLGLAAPHSVASGGFAIFWIANDDDGNNTVIMSVARQPKTISSTAITEAINSYSKIDDAIGLTYHENNHLFYEIIFPTANTSWIFDSTMPPKFAWHERKSRTFSGVKEVLGDEELSNNEFTVGGTDWLTGGTGVSFSNNTCVWADEGPSDSLRQEGSLAKSETYIVSVEVSSYTSGDLMVKTGFITSEAMNITGIGIFPVTITLDSDYNIARFNSDGFAGTVNSISYKTIITEGVQGVFQDGRHRINTHAFYNLEHIVGDFENGKIYELSRDYYDEDGNDLIAQRTSQPLVRNQDLLTFHELQILFTPGVGIVTGDAEDMDPKALVSWSDDGGFTFGNEIEVAIGKLGEYKNRAILYQLGQARNRLFRVKISAAVNRDILGAYAMVTVDDS